MRYLSDRLGLICLRITYAEYVYNGWLVVNNDLVT